MRLGAKAAIAACTAFAPLGCGHAASTGTHDEASVARPLPSHKTFALAGQAGGTASVVGAVVVRQRREDVVVHVRVARRLLADYAPLEISLWGSRRGDLDLTSSCDAVGLGSSAGNRLVGPVPMTGRTRDVVLPRTRLRAFYRHFASVSVAGKYTGTVWGCADLAPG